MKRWLTFLASLSSLRRGVLLLAFGLATAARSAEINLRIVELQRSIESTIQEKLDALVGSGSKILLTVSITEKKAAPVVEDSEFQDFAYAPVPMRMPSRNDQSQESHSIQIESVQADLWVTSDTGRDELRIAKQLVQNDLKGLNPRIQIKRWEKSKAIVPTKEIEKPKEGLLSQWAPLLPLLSNLLCSLFVSLGIFFVALALRFLGKSIVNGLSSESRNTGSVDAKPIELVASPSAPQTSGATDGPSRSPQRHTSADRLYHRHIALVKETLRESPLSIIKELKSARDLKGFRWLLSAFDPGELGNLKSLIGEQRLAELSRIEDETDAGNSAPDPSGPEWLAAFTQRIILRKLQGESMLEKALGPQKLIEFSALDSKRLAETAMQEGNRADWRLLSELLPASALEESLAKAGPEAWSAIFGSYDASPEEIRFSAERILEQMRQNPGNHSSEEKVRFFESRWLAPMIKTLSKLDFARQEEFLKQLQAAMPDIDSLLRNRFWTPARLTEIPNDSLAQRLRGLSYVQIASMLLTLPEPHPARLIRLLGEGNIKKMALDQLGRMKQRGSARELGIARTITSQIIESLRQDYLDQKFDLIAMPSADPMPHPKAEAA